MAPENAPATKRDLVHLEERVDSRLAATEAHLVEQIRDMQTEILKAFLPYQERNRIEFRELEANTNNTLLAVKERVGILERRLGEIEKRLFMNPPAA